MAKIGELLQKCESFDWDEHNVEKNWEKHRVDTAQCEEVFFNSTLIAASDTKHSDREARYLVLGQSNAQRLLFVSFTIRKNMIRIISARDMTRRERKIYEESEG